MVMRTPIYLAYLENEVWKQTVSDTHTLNLVLLCFHSYFIQAASGHFTLFPDLAATDYNNKLLPFSSPIITYADIVKAIKASPFGTATTATQWASFRTQGKGKDKATQTSIAQSGRLIFTQAKNKKILVTSEDNMAYIIKVGGVSSGRRCKQW